MDISIFDFQSVQQSTFIRRITLFWTLFAFIGATSAESIIFDNCLPDQCYYQNITIVPSEINDILVSSPFQITFQQSDFDNQTTKTNISARICVPKHTKPGNYIGNEIIISEEKTETETIIVPYNYTINGTTYFANQTMNYSIKLYSQREIDVEVRVLTQENFTILLENISVRTGEAGYIYANAKNTGNVPIRPKILSASSMFLINETVVEILPGFDMKLPMRYEIPKNISKGVYNETIVFGNFNYTFSVEIQDSSPPDIEVEVNTDQSYGEEFAVCVDVRDNAGVEKVEVLFNNKTYATRQNDCLELRSERIGKLPLTITATDLSGNKGIVEKEMNIKKLSGVDINDYIEISQLKPKSKIKRLIIDAPDEIEVNFTLISVGFIGVSNKTNATGTDIRVSIESGKENVRLEMDETVAGVNVKDKVYLVLEFYEREGGYTGVVQVDFPEYVDVDKQSTKIDFKGNVADFNVVGAWEASVWDKNLKGTPHVEETYGASYQEVCIKPYPIDMESKELVMPVTEEMYEIIRQDFDMREKECSAENETLRWHRKIMAILTALALIGSILYIKYGDRVSYTFQ